MLRRGFDPRHAVVVDARSGQIVDGVNRATIAAELGLDAVVLVRQFACDSEIAAFIAGENLARRHLSQRERSELAGRLVNGHGMSTRRAAKTAGVSQPTASRAASEQRRSDSSESPTRTNPRVDPRIARVRKALDLLAHMASETIPGEIRDALSDDELVALVAVLDVLAKTCLRSRERSGDDASTTVDSIIAGSPAA